MMRDSSKKRNIRAVDFFCGGGGMSLGMSKAGVNVLAGIDVDDACEATYLANNKQSRFLLKDVGDYSPEELSKDLNLQVGDDKLLFIGCSPCQYWSLLKSDKSKSRKTAFLLEHFQSFVDYFRPGYVVIENVPGILKKKESPLNAFRAALSGWGYEISENVVNANDYGVPQHRKRFVMIASRVRKIPIPGPDRGKIWTVADVLGTRNGFPHLKAGDEDPTVPWHVSARLSPVNLQRLVHTPKDGGTRKAWKNNARLQLNAYKDKDSQFSDVYGRMFWNRPSPTITTRFISISNGRFAHPEENRGISIREGACLQSFPRSFKIKAKGLQEAARLIGNAVPPRLAKAIGSAIVKEG